MEAIIHLLTEKNQNLEKFFRLNEAELENLSMGEFSHVELFYANREGILAIINKIDEMIERSSSVASPEVQIDPVAKKEIMRALHYKNDLVNRILEQDLKILSVIEVAKSNIIKELSQVRATRKALGSYKSGKPDAQLDEEA